jgi:hypothetical protein
MQSADTAELVEKLEDSQKFDDMLPAMLCSPLTQQSWCSSLTLCMLFCAVL